MNGVGLAVPILPQLPNSLFLPPALHLLLTLDSLLLTPASKPDNLFVQQCLHHA